MRARFSLARAAPLTQLRRPSHASATAPPTGPLPATAARQWPRANMKVAPRLPCPFKLRALARHLGRPEIS
eukprot:7186648-Pyramimonas_sp.AAC.1